VATLVVAIAGPGWPLLAMAALAKIEIAATRVLKRGRAIGSRLGARIRNPFLLPCAKTAGK